MNARAFAPETGEPETAVSAVARYLRVARVARLLDHSRQSVYQAIARGDLRAVKIFGSLRVAESEVLRYLAEREAGR